MLELHSSPLEELFIELKDNVEDLNALLNSLEEPGYMANSKNEVLEDLIAAPPEEYLGDKIDSESSYEDIQASTSASLEDKGSIFCFKFLNLMMSFLMI